MNRKKIWSYRALHLLLALMFLLCINCTGQDKIDPALTEVWEPEPMVIIPGTGSEPPSDAIVLFDGSDLAQWVGENKEIPAWKIEDGAMTVVPKKGGIVSKQSFGDCQLHVEFRTPVIVTGEGQGRGNSGVFLQKRYEVQVLDSYENRTYSNGQAGSIYKQHIPLVNACRKPGEWQAYDIIFTAPVFNGDGSLKSPGYMTVLHNGVLIQNHVELQGKTENRGEPRYETHQPKEPLYLQEHGNPVSYRNIWIREL